MISGMGLKDAAMVLI